MLVVVVMMMMMVKLSKEERRRLNCSRRRKKTKFGQTDEWNSRERNQTVEKDRHISHPGNEKNATSRRYRMSQSERCAQANCA